MSAVRGGGRGEHVFISYVREDIKRVDRLAGRLRATGITVWLDTSDLSVGEDWKNGIRRAIAEGMAFIACFSEHTERKDVSFQNKELIWAVDEMQKRQLDRVWFLPVRFADCRLPPVDLGLDRTLSSLQWVDLFGRNSWDEGIARLVASIRNAQAGRRVTSSAPDASSSSDAIWEIRIGRQELLI